MTDFILASSLTFIAVRRIEDETSSKATQFISENDS